MSIQLKAILTTAVCALALTGCGGSSVSESAQNGGNPSGSGDGISYVPLSVLEVYQEFSPFDQDDLFQLEGRMPYIPGYIINPVQSSTLLPVTNAQASDYEVTVDEIAIDPLESFPILQKVIGSEAFLSTALVFDISGSVSDVDMQALVDEAKNYIATAQASSDDRISNQQFVVWAFGSQVQELTNGFTTDAATLNAALDQVVTLFNGRSLGASSNLHRAVIQSIGRYSDAASGVDFGADGDNDLYDLVTSSGTLLSQLVIFSSGPDTYLEFEQSLMIRAIDSQAFVKYVGVSSGDTFNLSKPVFYYVAGADDAGVTYSALADNAEKVTGLTLSGGAYVFADQLVNDQIEAYDERVDLDNQYFYRFALQIRQGDHTVVFDSSSTDFSYSLTTRFNEPFLDPAIGTPEQEMNSLVEITGPNGEFVSGILVDPFNPASDYIATIDLSEENTFRPATRWVNEVYDPVSDYTWAISGGTGTVNGNGSYTVNSISGATATVTLTNILRNETADLIISNQ